MSSRLRILFVSDTGGQLGGAERSLLSLIERLEQSRYESLVLLAEEGRFATLLRGAHAEVIVARLGLIARTRNPLKLLLYAAYFVHGVLRLAWLVRRRKIDIVHINKNPLAVHAIPAAWLAGAASLWHVRNRASRFGRIGAWLVRRCGRLVFVSEDVAKPFRAAFPDAAAKMAVVHEGVEPLLYASRESGAAFRQSIGVSPDQPLVGTIGRLTAWKGQDDFLRAAAQVAETHPDARFAVVGDCVSSTAEWAADEAFRDGLRSLAGELGIADRVVFTGYREDVAAAMNALDVFVLPSHYEPFGLVVVEAMAAGRAIVATAAGGVPEIVRDRQEALLVEPRDPAAMAAAIGRLLTDRPLAERLARAAEQRVAADFPLWRHAAQFREIYGQLAPAEKT